jgi:hypothetical protein
VKRHNRYRPNVERLEGINLMSSLSLGDVHPAQHDFGLRQEHAAAVVSGTVTGHGTDDGLYVEFSGRGRLAIDGDHSLIAKVDVFLYSNSGEGYIDVETRKGLLVLRTENGHDYEVSFGLDEYKDVSGTGQFGFSRMTPHRWTLTFS